MFTGVRILRQDAWEALVGFICSSNNNIARISQMVEKLCVHYGPLVGSVGGTVFHDFPQPQALTGPGVEQHLRELGFGYRARYLYQTAVMVAEEKGGVEWLDSLRNPESPAFGEKAMEGEAMQDAGREGYRKAHEELLALQGVGPKVADCVSLMGLGWGEAVPVDTHGMFNPGGSASDEADPRNSMADRPARLQVRQGQAQQPDKGDLRRCCEQVQRAMGQGGRLGTLSALHS